MDDDMTGNDITSNEINNYIIINEITGHLWSPLQREYALLPR